MECCPLLTVSYSILYLVIKALQLPVYYETTKESKQNIEQTGKHIYEHHK